MWRIKPSASCILCFILCIGTLSPSIAVACEGAGEEFSETNGYEEAEKETESMTDFTFPAVGDTMRWTLDNPSLRENVTVGTLSLAGRDRASYNLENAANCNGFVLRRDLGTTCSVRVKLENRAGAEAEVLAPATFEDGVRVTLNKLMFFRG
jgi:hypothetical protein